jgi:hypothetical protein
MTPIQRAVYMLRVVKEFIAINELHGYDSHWDDAFCDGNCLIDDCESAAQGLERYEREKAGTTFMQDLRAPEEFDFSADKKAGK